MARVYLFAEGQTEQTFADRVLKPHLANLNVFLPKPVLIAHARKKGRVLRGGGRKYAPMKNDIVRRTKEDQATDVRFTTMVDLYALPDDFPGKDEALNQFHSDPYKRVEFLEKSFFDDICDPRFIPFIQLHEFEACLFCAPDIFKLQYENREKQIGELIAIAESFSSPELIDDSPYTAPSKRILKLFPNYEKVSVGVQLADAIGLSVIRGKCPHFNAWLMRLESLSTTPHVLAKNDLTPGPPPASPS